MDKFGRNYEPIEPELTFYDHAFVHIKKEARKIMIGLAVAAALNVPAYFYASSFDDREKSEKSFSEFFDKVPLVGGTLNKTTIPGREIAYRHYGK